LIAKAERIPGILANTSTASGDPRLSTLLGVTKALGLKLKPTPPEPLDKNLQPPQKTNASE